MEELKCYNHIKQEYILEFDYLCYDNNSFDVDEIFTCSVNSFMDLFKSKPKLPRLKINPKKINKDIFYKNTSIK